MAAPIVPPKGDIVRACRARAQLGMAAIGGFPDAAHFVEYNRHRDNLEHGVDWLVETFTMEPGELSGPANGGGVLARGLYILTWYGKLGAGEDVDAKLDELVRLYFSGGTYFRTAGADPVSVHVRGNSLPWIDGPNNVGAWAVCVATVPWYLLARNVVIP